MIYFCIPTYNEERTVGVVLWKLRQVMAELQRDYQIIVVDDASTDSTPAVLSPYIRVLPLTVIRNSARRGYTDSVELAVREAVRRSPYPKRDAVIVLQADFTEDPDVLEAMVKRFEAGADVVANDVALEDSDPRAVRWGRRYLRWILRRKEWSAVGDPLSGLRAYRVVVLKKAIEARGANRLLSWPGVGANVELLQQVLPHSRRNEVGESTLLHHRLQRPLRFVFMDAWKSVRGAASGKVNPAAKALPTDSIVATPLPIVPVERNVPAEKYGRGARGGRGGRPERSGRGERPAREQRPRREERPRAEQRPRAEERPRTERPRREKRVVEKPVVPAPVLDAEAIAAAPTEEVKKKRRRRPRRRKEKRTQTENGAPQLVLDETEAAPAASDTNEEAVIEGDAAVPKKKKSRRGRRGGRGRRRGPRTNGESADNGDGAQTAAEEGGSSEAAPPMVAEGD